ncbi:major facilitator superfamily multidrug-resistance, DHA1 sub-family [Cyathus striatus]|nr:major facilitator superfamily multidrug-resistance, DHA1 sub-family [Cyathus striatus]
MEASASARNDRNDNDIHEAPRKDDLCSEQTPLPKFQLFMVLLIQFAEPVTATVIYPFVNQFVRDTGITGGDEKKTGYYAGVIESAFFFAEALTVFQWGWLSDRFGRRPILLLGPLGLSLAMLGFGLSGTFWPIVMYRCLQGVFNGNIGVSKSIMAEITDSTNIGDAFALMPLTWSVGTTIGPIMGGVLSNPAQRWPDSLGRIAILRDHPYFLPSLAAAIIAFSTFVISFVGLKETLPSAIRKSSSRPRVYARKNTNEAVDASTSLLSENDGANYYSAEGPALVQANEAAATSDQKPPPLRDLLTRSILITFSNYVVLAFTDMSYQVLLPLMFSTPVSYGGLGLDPYTIGTVMGTWGFFNAIIQINFLGRWLRRYGARQMYILSYSSFFVCMGCYPIASSFAKQAGGVDAKVAIIVFIQLFFQTMLYMSYGSIHVLLVQSAPSKASLGSINGIAQMLGSVMRSIAPTFASSLFSISLQRHIAGGHMVYYVLLVLIVAGIRLSFMIPRK